MGIFFKSKRSSKNHSDNNIRISNENANDIKVSIDVIFKFMKEMRDDLKDAMGEINEEVKRTSKRIKYIENDVNDLKVRLAVLENIVDTHTKNGDK